MSLGGLIKQALNGKATWGDVGKKIESLFSQDVVDPVEAFGEQFLSDFGKAALAEAGTYVPQLLANPSSIGSLIPTIASDLESQGVKIAETDALQEANTVIGNALRVQLTAAQVQNTSGAASATAPAPQPTPEAAAAPAPATPPAG